MQYHLSSVRAAALMLPAAVACSACYYGTMTAGIPGPSAGRSAAEVLPTAERYIGVPYKWGGTSPSGFDCSGFTQYVFARHGVRLPRTSRAQASAGTGIREYLSLRPGDLIMFADDGRPISHVAIYAGRGRILHSSSSGNGVRYDDLGSRRGAWFREHMVVARRVGTAGQGMGIVHDIVAELRAAGVRVDFPAIVDVIGDLAPKP